jgi:hypothetical protein
MEKSARHIISASARRERVYSLLANYHDGHARVLPKPFRNLVVEQGGVGAGTVVRFEVSLLGRKHTLRAAITEPGTRTRAGGNLSRWKRRCHDVHGQSWARARGLERDHLHRAAGENGLAGDHRAKILHSLVAARVSERAPKSCPRRHWAVRGLKRFRAAARSTTLITNPVVQSHHAVGKLLGR